MGSSSRSGHALRRAPRSPPQLWGRPWGSCGRWGSGGGGPAVGALTGEHRRGWGRVYGLLMRDRLNRASIGRIQRSLLALALDAPVMADAMGQSPGGGAEQVLHGGGAGANSCNRWFDKALQVIVGADGSCGLLYDPEVLDGAVAAEMADHALAFCRSPAPGPAPGLSVPRPQRLRFCVGPEMGPEVQRARRHLDSLAADVELHCFSHEGFGPGGAAREEALLHVALQVAFFRLHGSVSACAEAPPLRPRPLPRPALVLPPGPRCRALAKALQEPTAKPEVLRALLWEAVEAQQQRMEEVAAGQGAERHLRALGLTAVAGGEPLPELFRDLGYARATHFRLCTLQVRSARGCLPLRGPLVPDGYGIGVGHTPSTSGPAHTTSCPEETTSGQEDPSSDPSQSTSGPAHATSCPKEPTSGHGTSPSDTSKPTSGHAQPTSGHAQPTSGHAQPTSCPAPLRVAVSAFASCGGTAAERLGAELRTALDQLGALLRGERPPAAGG